MCVSLPSSNIFFISTSFYLPSGIHRQESYKCSGDLRDLPIFNHLLSPSPIQLSHCGLEVIFSSSVLSHIKRKCTQTSFTYRSCSTQCRCTDCYTAWYCTRYGSLQERQVVSRLLRTCKSIHSLNCIHSRRFY